MSQGFVYLMYATSGLYKIGASKDPERRRSDLDGMPFSVTLSHAIASTDPFWLERVLHARFAHRHVRGEWFRLAVDEVVIVKSIDRCDSLAELPSDLIPPELKAVGTKVPSRRSTWRRKRALCLKVSKECYETLQRIMETENRTMKDAVEHLLKRWEVSTPNPLDVPAPPAARRKRP